MAKKQKAKKTAKKAQVGFTQKLVDALPLLLVGAILLTVLANIGWSNYTKRQQEKNDIKTEQYLLATELDAAGVEFDEIHASLQASGINGEVSRDTYCYHASRKFEVGPLYCVQRLDIVAGSSTDAQTLSDFNLVYTLLEANPRFDFVSNETIQSFDEDNRIFYYKGDNEILGCSVDYTAYGRSFGNDNSKNTYDISIDCLGGDFIDPIYPMNNK